MTNQEIFNIVSKHLLTQKQKAYVPTFGCVYHAPDGTKCAIGCLIPESKYHPSFEGHYIKCIQDEYHVFDTEIDYIFLDELRRIHDIVPIDNWHYKLTNLARCYGLQNDYA